MSEKNTELVSGVQPAAAQPMPTSRGMSLHPTQLLTVLRAEQQRGWAMGSPPRLEDYRELLDGGRFGPDDWIALIVNEVLLRERNGELPTPEEYATRFPALAERIHEQFQLLRLTVRDIPFADVPMATAVDDANEVAARSDERTILQRIDSHPVVRQAYDNLRVPGYEILGVLGRGGMGVVYKAKQKGLNRLVALKMILAGGHADDEDRKRFMLEAEAVAALRHPNIVQVYEIGEHEGKPFFSLEYVGGGTLSAKINGQPQPPSYAVDMIEPLARGIHVAHEQGIIHRDLKPANILLSEERDPASGQFATDRTQRVGGLASESEFNVARAAVPKITDFGLAKRLNSQQHLTMTGTVAGTPNYMAPEQVFAEGRDNLGPAVDTYALGVMLYEMLTGRPPFLADSPLEVMQLVARQEPVPPRQLQPKVPRDLETICLKCLQKDAQRRYPSALALAEDLRRFREGLPITARSVGRVELALRWCRRNPAIAGLLATVAFTLAIGIAVASYFALDAAKKARLAGENAERAQRNAEQAQKNLEAAQTQRQAAEQINVQLKAQTKIAEQKTEEARRARQEALDRESLRVRELYAARMNEAHLDWELGLVARSRELLAGYEPHRHDDADLRGFEWRYVNRLCNQEVLHFNVPEGARCVALGPDAGAKNGLIAWTFKQTIEVWQLSGNPKQLWSLRGHNARTTAVGFDPTGEVIVSTAANQTVRVWSAKTGAFIRDLKGLNHLPEKLAFSPDGKLVAVAAANLSMGGMPGEVIVWDIASGEVKLRPDQQKHAAFGVAFSRNGKRIAAAGHDGIVRVWDVENGKLIHSLTSPTGAHSVAYSPTAEFLAAGNGEGTVILWDGESGRELRRFHGHEDWVQDVAFSRDGKLLAAVGGDRVIRIWDTGTGKRKRQFSGHSGPVRSLAFSPTDSLLFSASDDGTLKGWNSEEDADCLTIRSEDGDARAMHLVADGRLAMVNVNHGMSVWSYNGQPRKQSVHPYEADPGIVASAASANGSRLIVLQSRDRLLLMRPNDPAAKPVPLEIAGLPPNVVQIAVDAAGSWLATSHANGQVLLHSLEGKAPARSLPLPARTVATAMAFHPTDPMRLACGANLGLVVHCDFAKSRVEPMTQLAAGTIRVVAWSPDGKLCAAGSDEGSIRLLDATAPEMPVDKSMLEGHIGPVVALAFHPDGNRLLSGGHDRTAKIWDTSTGRETLTLRGHSREVHSVGFAHGGRTAVTAGHDREIKIWDSGTVSLRELRRAAAAACRVRNLRIDGSMKPGQNIKLTFELANVSERGLPMPPARFEFPWHGMVMRALLISEAQEGVPGTNEMRGRYLLGESRYLHDGPMHADFRTQIDMQVRLPDVPPGKYSIVISQFWLGDRLNWISDAGQQVNLANPLPAKSKP